METATAPEGRLPKDKLLFGERVSGRAESG